MRDLFALEQAIPRIRQRMADCVEVITWNIVVVDASISPAPGRTPLEHMRWMVEEHGGRLDERLRDVEISVGRLIDTVMHTASTANKRHRR